MTEYLDIETQAPIDVVIGFVETDLSVQLSQDWGSADECYMFSGTGYPVVVKNIWRTETELDHVFIMVDSEFPKLQDEIWNKLITLPYHSIRFDLMDEITAEHDPDSALFQAA